MGLKIIYDPTFRKISTTLFNKPTNTLSYLSVNSKHKQSIFKIIPFSLLKRVKDIALRILIFSFFSRLLVSQLRLRGYCHFFLMSVVRRVSNLERKSLLPFKKNKSLSVSENHCFYVISYKIKLVNSVNDNLRGIFIHNCNLSMTTNNFKCNLVNCRSCKFFSDKSIINFCEKFSLPILSNSNCKSKFYIYIINCSFCNSFYVGESIQTLEKRLNAHISNIRCFTPFTKEYSEVALHFRKKGHDYMKHLKISIFFKRSF